MEESRDTIHVSKRYCGCSKENGWRRDKSRNEEAWNFSNLVREDGGLDQDGYAESKRSGAVLEVESIGLPAGLDVGVRERGFKDNLFILVMRWWGSHLLRQGRMWEGVGGSQTYRVLLGHVKFQMCINILTWGPTQVARDVTVCGSGMGSRLDIRIPGPAA